MRLHREQQRLDQHIGIVVKRFALHWEKSQTLIEDDIVWSQMIREMQKSQLKRYGIVQDIVQDDDQAV